MGRFRKPKYEETPAEKAMREDIERKRQEKQEEKEKKEAADKKLKRRKAKGMVGMRSLFSRAGGKGFFYEGEEN